jgi:hypothetical protein
MAAALVVNRENRIVRQTELLPRVHVQNEEWHEDTLYPQCVDGTPMETLRWCASRSLIDNYCVCTGCNVLMSLSFRERDIDGYAWRCRQCTTTRSVRTGSFFAKSKLRLWQLIKIMYKWCDDLPQTHIMREARIGWETMVNWANYCREICVEWERRNNIMIGGMTIDGIPAPLEVEIDESLYFHTKAHLGQPGLQQWVFGGLQRHTKKCFLIPVAQRDAATLLPLIEQHVLPGTFLHICPISSLLLQCGPLYPNGEVLCSQPVDCNEALGFALQRKR